MTFKVFNVCFERAEQKIGYDEYGEYAEIQRLLQTLQSSHELEHQHKLMGRLQSLQCSVHHCNLFRTRVHSYCTSKVAHDNQKMQSLISDLVQVLHSIAKFDSLLGILLNSQNLSKTTLKTKQFSHVQETNSGPIQSYITEVCLPVNF